MALQYSHCGLHYPPPPLLSCSVAHHQLARYEKCYVRACRPLALQAETGRRLRPGLDAPPVLVGLSAPFNSGVLDLAVMQVRSCPSLPPTLLLFWPLLLHKASAICCWPPFDASTHS